MAWWDSLISAGASLGGALLSSNANQSAADTAAAANERAAQINADAQREGFERYKALLDQAMAEATQYNERAQGTYRGMAAESQPAVGYLRQVAFSDPSQLTPAQQTGLADTRRSANANLAASGLRGAGRSGVATLNEAERRYRDAAFNSNRGRADSAASTLFSDNRTALLNDAATDRSTGGTRASILGAQGSAAQGAATNTGGYSAGLARDTGQTNANADLASANNWGSAMGALGSIFANEISARNKNYAQYTPGAV